MQKHAYQELATNKELPAHKVQRSNFRKYVYHLIVKIQKCGIIVRIKYNLATILIYYAQKKSARAKHSVPRNLQVQNYYMTTNLINGNESKLLRTCKAYLIRCSFVRDLAEVENNRSLVQ